MRWEAVQYYHSMTYGLFFDPDLDIWNKQANENIPTSWYDSNELLIFSMIVPSIHILILGQKYYIAGHDMKKVIDKLIREMSDYLLRGCKQSEKGKEIQEAPVDWQSIVQYFNDTPSEYWTDESLKRINPHRFRENLHKYFMDRFKDYLFAVKGGVNSRRKLAETFSRYCVLGEIKQDSRDRVLNIIYSSIYSPLFTFEIPDDFKLIKGSIDSFIYY